MIDTSTLTKIGNMTSGGGLSAIFDSDTSTTGYYMNSGGFVGVEFDSSTKLDKIIIKSAANGFDASGLTSTITLTLYGKTGIAPTSSTDGIALDSLTFTDINAVTTKELINSDPMYEIDFAWVTISSDVWSVASELELYEYTVPTAPSVVNSRFFSLQKSVDTKTALRWDPKEILGFRMDLNLNEAAVATLQLRMDIIHDGLIPDVIGVSGLLHMRSGTTWENCLSASFTPIENASSGQNIRDLTDHYGNINIFQKVSLSVPKYYQFAVYGSAHTTASSLDELCSILEENSKGLNNFILTINKDETLI